VVVAAHAFNPSTWEAEAAWFTEFQGSQGYTEKPYLEKKKKKLQCQFGSRKLNSLAFVNY
jgi:hypothetical protein